MPAATEFPTWEIVPTADGHFRWAASAGDPGVQSEPPPQTLAPGEDGRPGHRLSSMADLLVIARTKLVEGSGGGGGGRGDGGGFPLFRTGTGRPVSASESSIRKARSVLRGADNTDKVNGGDEDDGFPMFRTGSGKSVTVKESSIKKAAAVLEGKHINNGDEKPTEVGAKGEVFPTFRTGSGKSVAIKESSIRKVAAIFEEDLEKETPNPLPSVRNDDPVFVAGCGKSVILKPSSIQKALSILDGNNLKTEESNEYISGGDCTFSSSIFQASSGRTVNLTSAGITRATTLLGLEEDEKLSSLRCFEHTRNMTCTNITEWGNSHENFRQNMNQETAGTCIVGPANVKSVQGSPHSRLKDFYSTGSHFNSGQSQRSIGHRVDTSDYAQSPVKFQTAGGRYISISGDALKRARNLLGDSDLGILENTTLDQPLSSVLRNKNNHDETFWNKENIFSPSPHEEMSKNVSMTPLSLSKRKQSSSLIGKLKSATYMLYQDNSRKFALGNISSDKKMPVNQKPEKSDVPLAYNSVGSCRRIKDGMPLGGPLVEISNNIAAECMNLNPLPSEKKQPEKMSFVSPFKRPRNSRLITPLKRNTFLATGSSKLSATENSCHSRISNHYPFQLKRKDIKDFFGVPPILQDLSGSLPHEVRNMDADNALTYRFRDASGHDAVGLEAFQDMLLQSGASLSNATKEWVANHYRWIVWKLACFERCYPAQVGNKFLTVSNVLEELKYRYEREVNYGHRSAIKKILDGDASPASMMVLCVSAIRQAKISEADDINYPEYINKLGINSSTMAKSNCDTLIELTDGWYSLDALLDEWLSKQLVAGKLFVGQKLRIWGAGLCGWVGPISSLEASNTVRLVIHVNGTYRAHWAEKLGSCKNHGAPLAFSCIKVAGGKVPRTLVGITRIYPVLYRERFPDGGFVVRSERSENKALQKYNQRRCSIVEGIVSEQPDVFDNINDSDEGAKLYKILETAAEPEVIMADMTSEQLFSFSTYQAKWKEIRQSDMQKKIEKALKDAGLCSRDVTPLMRVRVVGLTRKHSCKKGRFREGLITIWNPTADQKVDLVEGKMYDVAGLMPLNFGMDVLYMKGGGSSTVWKILPSTEAEKYEPFFNPRKSVILSKLGEVPLTSEFDIAAIILHVGDVCISGRQKKQWIFVTDGCNCSPILEFQEQHDCLLAVSFSSPFIDNDSSGLFSHQQEGTVVGFFNLVKRARDQANHLWVAEATENSTYSVSYNLPRNCHLTVAAESAQTWANVSYLTIQKLRERVFCILGHHET